MTLTGDDTSVLVGGTFALISGTNCSSGRFGSQTVLASLKVTVVFVAEGTYNVCFSPEGSNTFYRQVGQTVSVQGVWRHARSEKGPQDACMV